MGKFTENMKNLEKYLRTNHPKAMQLGEALMVNVVKGFAETAIGQISKPAPVIPGETEVLDAEQIQQLYYMSTPQLKALFSGRKVAFATDKEAIAALYYLSTAQINAILGKE